MLDRREFERVGLPATALPLDKTGNELGRVVEISGGGLLLDPASPWARLALIKGQHLVVTVVEPGTRQSDGYVAWKFATFAAQSHRPALSLSQSPGELGVRRQSCRRR